MQITVKEKNGSRALVFEDEESTTTIRICTEAQIQNMSAGSLKLYRRKLRDWEDLVHKYGTPQAIRTMDFLVNACKRTVRSNNPPVC